MTNKWLKRVFYTIITVFVLLNIMAAFHAYKFTHFYVNVPPAKKPEQMSIGEKASAIFFGMNYPKSKVVDSLHIPHSTIVIKTGDSIRLESWYAKANCHARETSVSFLLHCCRLLRTSFRA